MRGKTTTSGETDKSTKLPIFRGSWEIDTIGRAARFGYGAAHSFYLFIYLLTFSLQEPSRLKNGKQYDKQQQVEQ